MLVHSCSTQCQVPIGTGFKSAFRYNGYYFTIGAKAGTSMKLSEDDKTDEILDVLDHKSTAKSDWENIKSPTGLIMSFGWHF